MFINQPGKEKLKIKQHSSKNKPFERVRYFSPGILLFYFRDIVRLLNVINNFLGEGKIFKWFSKKSQ